MRKKRFSAAIPIVMGVGTAILWRSFVPGSLSVGVYQWVYSSIIQAYAAMVAVVGMFAIYKLQLLRRNLETEAERLTNAVETLNLHYGGGQSTVVPEEGLTVSDDFVGEEKAFQNLGEQIYQSAKMIFDLGKRTQERAKTVPNEDKQKNEEKVDGYLGRIQTALDIVNGRYKRIEKAKKNVTRITKTIKVPLVVSGVLIGASLFLLSLSDKDIITTASSVFLWLLAVIIGTAVYLTYMLIREIIILVET